MKMNKNKKILIVASHPDDEVLGCGASIVKHLDNKDDVRILILGEGITSRSNISNANKQKLLKSLHKNFQESAKLLGVHEIIIKKFPDNMFDIVPLLQIIQEIEKTIDEYSPDIVYTHNKSDVNIDHRKTLEAVEAACRPLPKICVEKILTFEVPSSTEWNFIRTPFRPNVFNEISEKQLDKKVSAMRCYKSEMREFPHPRSGEYIKSLATVRGSQAGFKLAEAFELFYERVSQ